MVAYSFNGKWLPDWLSEEERKAEVFRRILKGIKNRTTRENPRAKPGDSLQLYWKQRTKECELIMRTKCILSYKIKFEKGMLYVSTLEGHWFKKNAEYFSKKEGFNCVGDMFKYFKDGIYHTVEW